MRKKLALLILGISSLFPSAGQSADSDGIKFIEGKIRAQHESRQNNIVTVTENPSNPTNNETLEQIYRLAISRNGPPHDHQKFIELKDILTDVQNQSAMRGPHLSFRDLMSRVDNEFARVRWASLLVDRDANARGWNSEVLHPEYLQNVNTGKL